MNLRRRLFACCWLIVLLPSVAAVTSARAQSTLAETMLWLRARVASVKLHDGQNWDWTFELAESKEPCTLIYRSVRTRPATPKSRRIENVSTVDMSALENEVRVQPWNTRGLNLFAIHLNAKPDAVLEQTWLTESREPDKQVSYLLIRMLDQDLAERVGKAFERAIALCKAERK